MSMSVLAAAGRKAAASVYLATAIKPRAIGFAVDAWLFDRCAIANFVGDELAAVLYRGMFQVNIDGDLLLEVVRK